ncbi:uncharacterized protein LOC129767485 [Toxorhynchites rutilus septentrionalis]|uniref:uncharacterized protein LOC129767485 n=1 Tax=Toxorhynchites rutilus septentrionalis TaxID=329112 RepID=UPI00247A8930|nr:uncharacterized protein LOC129767485 [Toxorhynchites rutilus septentrionalis]
MFSSWSKPMLPFDKMKWLILIASVFAIFQSVQAADVPNNCLQHTDVTGTFDQYFSLDEIGNQRSEEMPIDFYIFIELRNLQEEIAILLSSKDRSNQYPDFARSYEIRVGNVYTVIYRETVKMRAYHSPKDKLFPGDKFKMHFKIVKNGNITITLDDNEQKPLLNVYDKRGTLDVRYISFASRMNAYPITFYFKCDMEMPSTEGPVAEALQACPVCPKQKCEVIVKACTDNSKDFADPEKQKYYFYFNMYLSKNKGKGVTTDENLLK